MDHQNTIPSTLGPISGPGGLGRLPTRASDSPETPFAMKLVFWMAVGLLAYGAVKFFAH